MSAAPVRRARHFRWALAGVSLLVLSACSSENPQPDEPAPRAARQLAPSSPPVESLRPELAQALRARVRALPAFARLRESDQDWVLAKASARISDPNASGLEPLVQQLSEVRLFAMAEREEPLPAPPIDAPKGP